MRGWPVRGLVLAATLLLSACAGGAREAAPAKVAVTPADPALQTVELDQFVLSLPPGRPLAYGGSRLESCSGVPDILSAGGSQYDSENLKAAAVEGLQAAGVPVENADASLFATQGAGAPFLLRGRTANVEFNWCVGGFSFQTYAEGSLSVNWELYSHLARSVVYRTTTSGAADLAEYSDGVELVAQAYRLAARQAAEALARDAGFRDALRRASTAMTPFPAATRSLARVPAKSGTFAANAESLLAATVLVEAAGHGSGFFVSSDGYLLTNAHVVGQMAQVRVEVAPGRVAIGEVVARDPRRDVALVKVAIPATEPAALALALPAVGSEVYAIGAPLSATLSDTVTKGIVSAIRREPDGLVYIQADVDIQAGSSGGPLTDAAGNVVGMAVLGVQLAGGSIGLNFFIPIAEALQAVGLQVP